MKFLKANSIAPDETPHSAVSHLGLYCLPMSHKEDASLYELRLYKRFELLNDKMNTFTLKVPSKDYDKSGHPPSLISLLCAQWVTVD